ncbi:hypothetical protein AABM36_08365 [Kocuria sp. KSNUG]|uniref:hypothetical protein n=1 Tax=Kocuria sp. KSNUG TaxID=3136676 RepID=UPI003C300EFB
MRTLRGLEGVKIMVNLTTGDALVGRLARTGRDYLDLTSAELRSREGNGSLDGTVIIPVERVAWVQVVA